jgi:hypothetical protein
MGSIVLGQTKSTDGYALCVCETKVPVANVKHVSRHNCGLPKRIFLYYAYVHALKTNILSKLLFWNIQLTWTQPFV